MTAQVGLVQYQDPGCSHAEQSLELLNQPARAGSSSIDPMGGFLIPYPAPPSQDSLKGMCENIRLDNSKTKVPHLKFEGAHANVAFLRGQTLCSFMLLCHTFER
jgi:hypothetical protein